MAAGNSFSPTISVVVCTRDRPEQLDQCLAALARLEYPDYEVVAVDNAPSNAQAREVAERWGVRYLPAPVRGVTRARNLGARASKAEIVAYIDDDAVADPNWLNVLAQEFSDHRVAAVTGAILTINPAARQNANLAGGAERGGRRVVDRDTPGWFEIANFGKLGDESNMAFRRSVFEVWPGFDERLGRGAILDGGEGHYAFFELIERGFRIIYNPEAIVRHPGPHSLREHRSRHLRVMATTAAYVAYLAIEHPSCRGALRQYVLNRLRGTTRQTGSSEKTGSRIAPRWLSLLAMLYGPWIYIRSRMASGLAAQYARRPASFAIVPETSTALGERSSHVES